MRRALCLLLTLLCLTGLFSPCYAAASFDREIDTFAQSVLMQSLDTGDVLYEKASEVRRSPASLTKIMTALVVLKSCENPAEQRVTVPNNEMFEEIIREGGVNIALQEGETLTVLDLLYAIMLPSACDAAELLAWHFGKGNIQNFITMMNDTCLELGLENTQFANPHGLEAQMHYSCAADIAVITRKALEYPLFREIISKRSYTIPATEKKEPRTVSYTIAMLSPGSSSYYEGMNGVKSGYTSQAGRCLTSTASRDGNNYLLVVMGANLDPEQKAENRNLSYDDTKALYDYAFNNYELKEVIRADAHYQALPVEEGIQSTVNLITKEAKKLLCPKGAELRYEITAPKSLKAPVGDQAVGKIEVYLGDKCLASAELFPANAIGAVAPTVTQKPSPYTGSQNGSILTNDPLTVILLLSLAVTVLVCVLIVTVARLVRNKRRR